MNNDETERILSDFVLNENEKLKKIIDAGGEGIIKELSKKEEK